MAAPLKHPFTYAIAIPASFVSDIPHQREKTFRIGLIGRAAAIFRVDQIFVYRDMPTANQNVDIKLVQSILSYMETPQYLRRRLFKIMPELQYAGALPPLRTPHHPTANRTKDLTIGDFREGVVTSITKEGALVDIGVEQPFLIEGAKLKTDTRVTVKITELDRRLEAALAKSDEVSCYWGYSVTVPDKSLGRFLRTGEFELVIATSRKGRPIADVLDDLKEKWKSSRKTLIAFGAPAEGLHEIVSHEQLELQDLADFVVNTVPMQATETIRTEEAVYATLSILNTLCR